MTSQIGSCIDDDDDDGGSGKKLEEINLLMAKFLRIEDCEERVQVV